METTAHWKASFRAGVGRFDRGGVGEEGPPCFGVRPIERGDLRVELSEGCSESGVGGGGWRDAGGHEQREDLVLVLDRVNAQAQFQGMDLGSFLIGREDAGFGAGDGESGSEVGVVGVQHIPAQRWVRVAGVSRT